ncbi:MAG: CDP-diacylglycerol--glycerol-3-phosphate 3-phosphatidyltransferase [Oscillospiraceae bacterium]|nr:CDP-diacylglycerol--glycerol-3-phosphate 3-phosphatidyltransferase [Oscillospiraceae bacterium]
MTTANKLTLLRMALIPVFLGVLYAGFPGSRYVALGVFIAASLTDMLDGYIARHYNQITDFGKFMDPLADKVLVMAAMCWFVEAGRMPGWVLAIVLFREFAVSGMRLVAVEQGRVIAAGWSGKVKTAATMVCLCLMLLIAAPAVGDSAPDFVASISNVVIVATTLYSGVEYFIKNRDVFKNAK